MTLDGHDFAELDYHWLRGQMAMVPQDPEVYFLTSSLLRSQVIKLFADSIRNNMIRWLNAMSKHDYK